MKILSMAPQPGTFMCSVIMGLMMLASLQLHAQTNEGSGRCDIIQSSVEDAGFADTVTVHCDQGYAHLTSDSYPDHQMMTGITGTNDQIPVPANGYSAPVVLAPALTNTPKTRDSSLGVAVNGVPIFDYTAGGELTMHDLLEHQPSKDTLINGQLDHCGGHSGRADDYHYHKIPNCMIEQMDNAGDDAIIGWAFDGYPIYGHNNPDGSPISADELDICNGKPDPVFGYRYHTSDDAPYIVQCLMGEVGDLRALPRISNNRPSGIVPRGGVEDLVFEESEDGSRLMTYNYRGESYYISYTPTDTENCYDFKYKTVSTRGSVESGEYCSRAVSGSGGRRR